MIEFETFTETQKNIVKEICLIQLNSLRRIYNNGHHAEVDMTMLLIENEVEPEEFKHQIEMTMAKFKEIRRKPESISKLSDDNLSMIRHILSEIEEQYKAMYPRAVANLWNKLFVIEDFRNINLN